LPWSWQPNESKIGEVFAGEESIWSDATIASPQLDAAGLAKALRWEVLLGSIPLVGDTLVSIVHTVTDFGMGLFNRLTSGLIPSLAGVWNDWNSLVGGSLSIDPNNIPLPFGLGTIMTSSNTMAGQAGSAVGQAIQIFAGGASALGYKSFNSLNSGLALAALPGVGVQAAIQLGEGNGTAAALLLGQLGLGVIRATTPCSSPVGIAAGVGIAGLSVYHGYVSARENFNAGNYLTGVLDVLQAGVGVLGAWQACFAGDMLLNGEYGKVRADQVELGTRLWSRDENDPDGPLVLKRVIQTFDRSAQIWEVRVAGQVISTTDEHPFWVASRGEQGEWVPAWKLQPGDLLRTQEGALVAVESVTETDRWESVYNWEIEDYHTYFVSATSEGAGLWAHNAGACGAGSSPSSRRKAGGLYKGGQGQVVFPETPPPAAKPAAAAPTAHPETTATASEAGGLYTSAGVVEIYPRPGQVGSAYPQSRRAAGRRQGRRPTDPPVAGQEQGAWDLTPANIARMETGRPPIGRDNLPVEIHHQGQNSLGPLFEMTSTTHDAINHPLSPSTINRTIFAGERRRYWIQRARELLGQQ
jgi:hypothetical protein